MTISSVSRFGVTADHQRRRKRPRLRGEIFDPCAGEPDFLAHFAPHRFLDRFAGLGRNRQGTTTSSAESAASGRARNASPAIASMITTGSVRGKCSALQEGQSRRQPPCVGLRRRAAIGTEAVARVPAEHRLGLGERRHMLGVDRALHRDRAQIDELEIAPRLQRLDRRHFETDAEARRFTQKAEKHGFARRAAARAPRRAKTADRAPRRAL